MADTGFKSPGTVSQVNNPLTYIYPPNGEVWSNVANAKVDDSSYATTQVGGLAQYAGSTGTAVGKQVSVLVLAGTPDTDKTPSYPNYYSGTLYTSDTYATDGTSSDTWGATLTTSDVNDSGFGFAVWFNNNKGADYDSSMLLAATNFGFDVPAGATIDGIVAQILCHADSGDGSPAYVNYMQMKIYYTAAPPSTPSTNAIAFAANF